MKKCISGYTNDAEIEFDDEDYDVFHNNKIQGVYLKTFEFNSAPSKIAIVYKESPDKGCPLKYAHREILKKHGKLVKRHHYKPKDGNWCNLKKDNFI